MEDLKVDMLHFKIVSLKNKNPLFGVSKKTRRMRTVRFIESEIISQMSQKTGSRY